MHPRPLLLALALAAAAPAALGAQGWRLSVTPFAGRAGSGPLFDHHVRRTEPWPGGEGQEVTTTMERRLSLADFTVAGARLEYRPRRTAAVFVEGSYGKSQMRWLDHYSAVGSGAFPIGTEQTVRREHGASLAELALGAAWRR